jgi:hypothetical protein
MRKAPATLDVADVDAQRWGTWWTTSRGDAVVVCGGEAMPRGEAVGHGHDGGEKIAKPPPWK